MATARPADYLPAVRFDFLTPVFDVFVRGTTRERTFKQKLLDQARLEGDLDVLDLGSGTGTLAIWAKQREPALRIRGLDGDPAIIGQARRKAAASGRRDPVRRGAVVRAALRGRELRPRPVEPLLPPPRPA